MFTVQKINDEWREILIDIEDNLSKKFRYIISKTSTSTSNLISTVRFFFFLTMHTHLFLIISFFFLDRIL